MSYCVPHASDESKPLLMLLLIFGFGFGLDLQEARKEVFYVVYAVADLPRAGKRLGR